MGYGVHLELGDAHEVTIETPFEVVEGDTHWGGEPLSADAAGALLALNLREITSGQIAMDGTLVLGVGSATLTVPPQPMYEAWQVRGPDGLLIVCPPGGEYVARLGARAPYIAALPTHAHSRDPVGFRPASPPPTGAWNRRRSRIRTEPLT
jgi:hypothetical protein